MAYLVPKSAGDDCVIQRDHCRELLVFWCFGVYKITAMLAKYSMGKCLCLLVSSIVISFLVVGYQATGDFSEECPPLQVSYEWIVSATSNSIHIVGSISSFIPSSGSSRYRQFGGHPEMNDYYRLIDHISNKEQLVYLWYQQPFYLLVVLVIGNCFGGFLQLYVPYGWIMSSTRSEGPRSNLMCYQGHSCISSRTPSPSCIPYPMKKDWYLIHIGYITECTPFRS
ncbi:hypothetical protein O0I10_001226 [Lichtheimia ornata]|uniref:Uncharacterized protein n=1 Tax=Lichtheimia ornata TaxID=688661 RepID=A0AAD7Y3F7_9FUNG|nr:uncharacterized protein O0I10_001226 [Lichtheimia ornata]KAJ8663049.1 hypothetical protein O0I10_001226 [Lichtheimia ornata]